MRFKNAASIIGYIYWSQGVVVALFALSFSPVLVAQSCPGIEPCEHSADPWTTVIKRFTEQEARDCAQQGVDYWEGRPLPPGDTSANSLCGCEVVSSTSGGTINTRCNIDWSFSPGCSDDFFTPTEHSFCKVCIGVFHTDLSCPAVDMSDLSYCAADNCAYEEVSSSNFCEPDGSGHETVFWGATGYACDPPDPYDCQLPDGSIDLNCMCENDSNCHQCEGPDDPLCQEDFCDSNPTHPACVDPPDFCAQNPDHPACNDGPPDFCQERPWYPQCQDNSGFCDQNPNHPACSEGGFCAENPWHPACIDPGEFCDQNPNHPACTEPPDFCEQYPNDLRCIDFCQEFPNHQYCEDEPAFCDENPESPLCVDCEEQPEHPVCQEPGSENFCDENPESPFCQDSGSFCTLEPGHPYCADEGIPCYGPGCEDGPGEEPPGGDDGQGGYASGSTCRMQQPSCSREVDPVGCAILWQSWYNHCRIEDTSGLEAVLADVSGGDSMPGESAVAELSEALEPGEPIDVGMLDQSGFLPVACPAAVPISFWGYSFELQLTAFCDLATLLRPLFLALMGLVSLRIIWRAI